MSDFVSRIYAEQGNEIFMQKDREYFQEHPDEECYLRNTFLREPHACPYPVPYMVVFNLGDGVRFRIPYEKSSLSSSDIEELKHKYRKPMKAMRKRIKSKSKNSSKDKSKGFSAKH